MASETIKAGPQSRAVPEQGALGATCWCMCTPTIGSSPGGVLHRWGAPQLSQGTSRATPFLSAWDSGRGAQGPTLPSGVSGSLNTQAVVFCALTGPQASGPRGRQSLSPLPCLPATPDSEGALNVFCLVFAFYFILFLSFFLIIQGNSCF